MSSDAFSRFRSASAPPGSTVSSTKHTKSRQTFRHCISPFPVTRASPHSPPLHPQPPKATPSLQKTHTDIHSVTPLYCYWLLRCAALPLCRCGAAVTLHRPSAHTPDTRMPALAIYGKYTANTLQTRFLELIHVENSVKTFYSGYTTPTTYPLSLSLLPQGLFPGPGSPRLFLLSHTSRSSPACLTSTV